MASVRERQFWKKLSRKGAKKGVRWNAAKGAALGRHVDRNNVNYNNLSSREKHYLGLLNHHEKKPTRARVPKHTVLQGTIKSLPTPRYIPGY